MFLKLCLAHIHYAKKRSECALPRENGRRGKFGITQISCTVVRFHVLLFKVLFLGECLSVLCRRNEMLETFCTASLLALFTASFGLLNRHCNCCGFSVLRNISLFYSAYLQLTLVFQICKKTRFPFRFHSLLHDWKWERRKWMGRNRRCRHCFDKKDVRIIWFFSPSFCVSFLKQ